MRGKKKKKKEMRAERWGKGLRVRGIGTERGDRDGTKVGEIEDRETHTGQKLLMKQIWKERGSTKAGGRQKR